MVATPPSLPISVLTAALEAVDACVAIFTGPDLRYAFVNAAYRALRPGADMLGHRLRDIFPAAAEAGTEAALEDVMRTGVKCKLHRFHAPLENQPDALWEGEYFRTDSGDPGMGLIVVAFIRNVTDSVATDKALRDSTALLTAISDTSTDVIYAKDRQGRLRFANPATLGLIGKPFDQVIGRTDAELLEDAEAARKVMENDCEVMNSGTPLEFEELVPSPSGDQKIWLSRKLPYIGEDGNVVGLLGISRDITERKGAEQVLREESSRKDVFLAMLAHELRNPLAPISTGAQLLERFAGDPQRVLQTSRIIARQASHMVALIDDLLDVSRVTRGLVALKKTPIAVEAIIARAVEQAQPMMDQRHQRLTVNAAPDSAWINGDQNRLTQTIANILGNAAKFTHHDGEISVTVAVRDEWIDIAIADNGNGIDAALMPKVFDLFTQSERAPDRAQGGLGLGLSLVQSIVTMHGGQVRGESDGIGRGSTFTVSLPRIKPPGDLGAPAEDRASPSANASCARDVAMSNTPLPTIMLVDDNKDAGSALADLLGAAGYEVTLVADGQQAIDAARESCPDVFILDIGLPRMDGYELAARLREQPAYANATLIALTGYGQAADRARGATAGFDHYYVKPVKLETLNEALSSARPRPPVPAQLT